MFFLCSMPNHVTIIPVMDVINGKLTAHAHDQTLSLAIKASLELGKKTLNRYYSLMDSLEVYRIAMGMWPMFLLASSSYTCQSVLHPCHKLAYFKMAGWEQKWIETARELVRDALERSYKQKDTRDQDEPTLDKPITGKKVHTNRLSLPCITQRFQSSAPPNMFDSLPLLSAPK